ncbi:rhomboid family intramembrane serine protease GlpG [Agitococcus lubricus]|uniref:GlpG protein n=1 Tax=Agitococcus lubricus TaxID=1077255 RepID=A0A2T5IVK1_9GAMM|nr:rhomboid family intramembrane serine protease GlpG [Agitococcus lubricus]PTQ87893.1 GlpG protein [Agitococcus lubricus]
MIELAAFNEHRVALAFSDYLKSLKINNHIEVEPDRFAILVLTEEDLPVAEQELKVFLQNPNDARYWQASWQTGEVIKEKLHDSAFSVQDVISNLWARSGVVTLMISVVCITTFIIFALLGKPVFDALSYPENIKHTHEYWRLLTPVFLHFSLLHLLFNLIWWWDLGGLIEQSQSKMQLIGVFLATALLSNFAQSFYGVGFGGLSGVVYGLLGYIWLYPILNPKVGFRLRPAIVIFMIVWLMIGYSGILDNVLGQFANSAHLIGLLTGVGLGIAFGLLHRFAKN